jgi:GNAT superfamily N-acetyltransferase
VRGKASEAARDGFSSPKAILMQFDLEMRRDPVPPTGSRVERSGALVRIVGKENYILWSALDAATARAMVSAQATFFRDRGREVEWKLYGYDAPRGLKSILSSAGFEPEEAETLVVLDLESDRRADPPPDGIQIRRVTDDGGARDAARANSAAFGPEARPSPIDYASIARDPDQALFVAHDGDVPVGSGRVEMPRGRSFASLWGGGTVPAYRHRGIYRGLVAARAALARRRGYRFVTVDAQSTSRPILERLGFVRLTTTTGWRLRPTSARPRRRTK